MEQGIYRKMAHLESHHWWYLGRRDYLNGIIKTYISSPAPVKVCEIGCGTGGNLEILSALGALDALELNDEARYFSEKKALAKNIRVYPGSLPDDIPLTDQYDAVFSLDVIEHIDNDDEALLALHKLVAKGGKLVLSVPAYMWLWSGHDEANHHRRRYTKKQLIALVESAGFRVVYASYFNTILFPLAVAKRLLEPCLPSKNLEEAWQVDMPSTRANNLLSKIFGFERRWAGKWQIPFGLSIIIVAELF